MDIQYGTHRSGQSYAKVDLSPRVVGGSISCTVEGVGDDKWLALENLRSILMTLSMEAEDASGAILDNDD